MTEAPRSPFTPGPRPGADATDLAASIGPPARDDGRRRSLLGRVVGRGRLVLRYHCPVRGEFVKATKHAVTMYVTCSGPAVGKYFTRSDEARAALHAEQLSDTLFGSTGWKMPILRWRRNGYVVPRLPDESRLDLKVHSMSPPERLDVAVWALSVLIDIYDAGYTHGDLQPHNVWYVNGRPVVTDFETLSARSGDHPFMESGDITGIDPVTGRRFDAAFAPADEWSFDFTVGIPLEQACDELRNRLTRESSKSARAARRLDILEGRST